MNKINDTPQQLKLDYTIQSPQERVKLVSEIISNTPEEKLNSKYLEILSDYIIFAMDKEERKQNKILTDNHMVTVKKRETSYQGLVSKFENGEDGVFNLITNDKNVIFRPDNKITESDVDSIPALKQLKEAIATVEKDYDAASGKRKFLLKKQLIDMRQEQYVIRNELKNTMYCGNGGQGASSMTKGFSHIRLDDNIFIDQNGMPVNLGSISFFNYEHISALLCNYSKIKEDGYDNLLGDSYYMMLDLDKLCTEALANYPLYEKIVLYKIDGKQNIEIQDLIFKEFGIKHSVEYISSLWRNKIPKIIADYAIDEYLIWHYTYQERGKWKKCSRCGQIKLANNRFFSRNNTSKDHFYSICKQCRNKKKG